MLHENVIFLQGYHKKRQIVLIIVVLLKVCFNYNFKYVLVKQDFY